MKSLPPKRLLVLSTLSILLPTTLSAELRPGPLFSDGMVLQRDRPIPVRGTADPGETVTVSFQGASVSRRTDDTGHWQIDLPASAAGGPYTLTIEGARETVTLEDVLVGDVWLCSGQSNMEWVVEYSMNAAAEIALATDTGIRHFKVPRSWSATPAEELVGGSWQPADSDHVGDFTAVGYFFARQLRRDIDVPVGLVNSTWGGSRIEAWMSARSLEMGSQDVERVLEQEKQYEQEIRTAIEALVGTAPDQERGLVGDRAPWADPALDDSSWSDITVPSLWESQGYEGMDGVAWYRTTFQLTEEEAHAGVVLGLGAIDDSDISWVNGHEIGRTENAWTEPRVYEVPPEFLVPGRNVIAIRVEDPQGGGGIHGHPSLLYVEVAGQRRSLAGIWRFAVDRFTVNLEDHKRVLPTLLYNAMLAPLQRYPIRGILWYQGESNADTLEDALAYGDLFVDMIRDWRHSWQDDELPFVWAQLANFNPPPTEPVDSAWARMRESQSSALTLPRTEQAVLIDVGEALDIHPRDKQAVGYRLALAARAVAYGEDIVGSGPTYRGHTLRGDRIEIAFDHVGEGLVARDPAGVSLRGFAIAGADRQFVWANASIEGDRVIVWSPEVTAPVAVRYGWADNPAGANLYNRSGLPAAPFRTDSW